MEVKVVTITETQLRDLLTEAATTGARAAIEATQKQDRFVNQTEAAALLGIKPNTFSTQRLWQYIKHTTLPGSERRYLVSDVLKYQGPSTPVSDNVPDNKDAARISYSNMPAAAKRGPGRPSKVVEMNCTI